MADLRREVSRRLRDTLHGREIDTIEYGTPEMEHMLGVVPLGAISTEKVEKGTILDPEHDFWQAYYEDINTENAVRTEIETAMKSLKEDDIFRVTTPYGDDAGILYVEVGSTEQNDIVTTCVECGASIETKPEIVLERDRYVIQFDIDCSSCGLNKTVGNRLVFK